LSIMEKEGLIKSTRDVRSSRNSENLRTITYCEIKNDFVEKLKEKAISSRTNNSLRIPIEEVLKSFFRVKQTKMKYPKAIAKKELLGATGKAYFQILGLLFDYYFWVVFPRFYTIVTLNDIKTEFTLLEMIDSFGYYVEFMKMGLIDAAKKEKTKTVLKKIRFFEDRYNIPAIARRADEIEIVKLIEG